MDENAADGLILNALTKYLEDSLEKEIQLREILSKAGYNDPGSPVEECLLSLVQDYLRLTTS